MGVIMQKKYTNDNLQNNLTENERAALAFFRSLNNENKKYYLALLKQMVKCQTVSKLKIIKT